MVVACHLGGRLGALVWLVRFEVIMAQSEMGGISGFLRYFRRSKKQARCGACDHRNAARRKVPKIAAACHFEGVQLLNHSAPTRTTHVHLLPMVPSYNGIESIELNSQRGSR